MKMLLLLFFSSSLFAGSFVGNPADRKGPGDGAAWFLGGERKIHWCSDQAQEFEPHLISAMRTWQSYIERKAILHTLRPFAFTLERLESCDGREDLRIELGSNASSKTLSFSEQTHFDVSEGWSKGRIWVNRALQGEALETQLLHQVGHVLGNAHVPGTVMAEEVAESPEVHLEIDGRRELYLCRECEFTAVDARGTSYHESNGKAEVSGPQGFSLEFISDLGSVNMNEVRLFVSVQGEWKANLVSEGLARLAMARGLSGEAETAVMVQRNLDGLVIVRRLNDGQILYEAP